MEKTNFLKKKKKQDILDCTGEYGNEGCQKGWTHTEFKWLQDKGGYVDQSEYPYTGNVISCVRINTEGEKALMDAVTTIGTVAVAYNADTQQYASYINGMIDVPDCGSQSTYAALLIGYVFRNKHKKEFITNHIAYTFIRVMKAIGVQLQQYTYFFFT
ncbi:hypothetical protein BJ944DRAFT_286273 [Cunninghamella echinulata]|nr:hypothetical protein BJ944DRAFT_286273 [Cunninghamella echinulata]